MRTFVISSTLLILVFLVFVLSSSPNAASAQERVKVTRGNQKQFVVLKNKGLVKVACFKDTIGVITMNGAKRTWQKLTPRFIQKMPLKHRKFLKNALQLQCDNYAEAPANPGDDVDEVPRAEDPPDSAAPPEIIPPEPTLSIDPTPTPRIQTPTPRWTPPPTGSWQPPIGIPRPEFGIEETYRMYDDPARRAPGLTYFPNPEGGFYTHTNLQRTLPAGSVVQLSEHLYGQGQNITVEALGTQEYPIFIRGPSQPPPGTIPAPTRNGTLRFGGSYAVLENLHLDGVRVFFHNTLSVFRHLAIRHLEISRLETGSAISIGNGASHIVVFGNHIHHNGPLLTDTDSNSMGVSILSNSSYVWVLDNTIHHNGADSIHCGHNGVNISHIYVGRNEMGYDRENALDFKTVANLVISQNRMYGYRQAASSNGDALRINDEGDQDNIWILFNEIFDSTNCISVFGADFRPYIIGNIMYDCQRGVYDNGRNGVGSVVVNNTFNSVQSPIIAPLHEEANLVSSAALANVPQYCTQNHAFQLSTSSAILFVENGRTKIRFPGRDLSSMGVKPEDRINLSAMPEILYHPNTCLNGCLAGGTSTRPICGNQWVDAVAGDTITLHRHIACPGVTNVNGASVTLDYYPSSQNSAELIMPAHSGFEVGDHIEYGYDGVMRTVTAVSLSALQDPNGNSKDVLTFSPALGGPAHAAKSICNWGDRIDYRRSFKLLNPLPSMLEPAPEYELFPALFYGLPIQFDFSSQPRPQPTEPWDSGAMQFRP